MFRQGALITITLLTACNGPNPIICPSGKPMVVQTEDATGFMSKGEACAANWASRLAKSSEPFAVISRVVQEHCSTWAHSYASSVAKDMRGADAVTAQEEQRGLRLDAQRRIIELTILQTRAGNCDPT